MQGEHSCPAFVGGGQGGSKMKPPAVSASEHAGPRNGYGDSVNLTLAVPAEIVEKQVNFSLFPIR